MSEPYQIFVLIPDGIHAEKIVYDIDEILENMGGVLDEDSMLILNETQDEEPEPEYITAPTEALATLAKWPTFGAIAYSMPEFVITVAYKGVPYTNLIQAIKISMMERGFERGGDETKKKYTGLAQKLHEKYKARRTIMDWGIEYKGFCWDEEIERLKKGKFMGEYAIIDVKDVASQAIDPIEIT